MGLATRKYWPRFVVVSLIVTAVSTVRGIRHHEVGTFIITGLLMQGVYACFIYSYMQGQRLSERNINSNQDREEGPSRL